MNREFQDRIDEYLLHPDRMSEEEKAQFKKEIEEDAEKKEQFEFTKEVRDAIVSRGEKLKAIATFRERMEAEAPQASVKHATNEAEPARRKPWLWISGIAAILIIGFFALSQLAVDDSQSGAVRGGDDVFRPGDSIETDTIRTDTTISPHE